VQLEASGRPTVVVATTAFASLARQVAATYHVPDARIAVIEHPLGGISTAEVLARAEGVVEDVLALFTASG
jgi:surfactin synthase thioesterase subunit